MNVTVLPMTAIYTKNSLEYGISSELLASIGARYSRNGEGVDTILNNIDFSDTEKAINQIFAHIDFGHASIGDMSIIPMFLDKISIYLTTLIWNECQVVSGQETSTRYVKYENSLDFNLTGLPENFDSLYQNFIKNSFDLYNKSLNYWKEYISSNPKELNLPKYLIEDDKDLDKNKKIINRIKRNFGFDRSRVFIPLCALTNCVLIMSSREWVYLCCYLLSHVSPEAVKLGALIQEALKKHSKNMSRHANYDESWNNVIKTDYENDLMKMIYSSVSKDYFIPEHKLEIYNNKINSNNLKTLSYRKNRYSPFTKEFKIQSIGFEINGITFGEIRDLNRHRSGARVFNLIPLGFYYNILDTENNSEATKFGNESILNSFNVAKAANYNWPYLLNLGHQFKFEHHCQLDKLIYELELRTGTGAHYRYYMHCKNILDLLYKQIPGIENYVFEGTAEPE